MKKIKRRINVESKETLVEITSSYGLLQVRLTSRMSPQQRRAIVASFLAQIKPWFQHFNSMTINNGVPIPDFGVQLRQDIRLPKYCHFKSEPVRLGFDIRMQRLEFGWTQAELATRSQINRSHLSEIERGLFKPCAFTLKKLELALSCRLTQTRISRNRGAAVKQGLTPDPVEQTKN